MSTMHPADRAYRNQTVRLADLTVISDQIKDVTFENCIIEGPAVINFVSCTVQDTGFDGHIDAVLWEIPDTRKFVIGGIQLVNCAIYGCSMRRVGIVGTAEQIAAFRSGLSD